MAANSLPGLPTELIIQIFKFTKKLATATALGIYRRRKSPISLQGWKDLEIRLESVNEDLHKSPLDTRPLKSKVGMDWRFMAHGLYLDIKDSGKGVRLADLLPLNKGTGYPWPRV